MNCKAEKSAKLSKLNVLDIGLNLCLLRRCGDTKIESGFQPIFRSRTFYASKNIKARILIEKFEILFIDSTMQSSPLNWPKSNYLELINVLFGFNSLYSGDLWLLSKWQILSGQANLFQLILFFFFFHNRKVTQ